ncbi:hypothetical protein [Mangrovicoccus ximenensis]|uniref:hypothetical protein n=1 Tax=Mangrovicoccus ximenensis TaxID=1911570 RepID=UPI001F171AD4|nr:hypothetical protein [Mangrovicoccus ximenensis]
MHRRPRLPVRAWGPASRGAERGLPPPVDRIARDPADFHRLRFEHRPRDRDADAREIQQQQRDVGRQLVEAAIEQRIGDVGAHGFGAAAAGPDRRQVG